MAEEEAREGPADEGTEFAWKGHKLDEMGGAQVGRVEGTAAGTAEWLVARMGRFGHHCLVPARDAVEANGRVWVPYTRDQIRRAPRFDPKGSVEAEFEHAVLEHYNLNPLKALTAGARPSAPAPVTDPPTA